MRLVVGAVSQPSSYCQVLGLQVEVHDGLDGRSAVGGAHQRGEIGRHDDGQVVRVGGLLDVILREAVADGGGEMLLAKVGGRVHAGEKAEVRMARDGGDIASLGQRDGITIQQTADGVERLRAGQVDLVEQHPIALANGRHQGTFDEREGKVVLDL